MEFTPKMDESYWLTEYQKDIIKLNKQIDYFKSLIESEKNQPKPRLRRVFSWGVEIQDRQCVIDSREKAINRINNK